MSHNDPFTPRPLNAPDGRNIKPGRKARVSLPPPGSRKPEQPAPGLFPLPPRRRKRPKRHDAPDPEAMKDRPVAAAGELKAKPINELESLPEDSIGGVHPPPPPPPSIPQRRKPAHLDKTIRINTKTKPDSGRNSGLKSNSFRKLLVWTLVLGSLLSAGVVSTVLVVQKREEKRRRDKEVQRRIKSIRLKHELRRRNIQLPPGECAPNMAWISLDGPHTGFCIDVYEFPNKKGELPATVSDSEEAKNLCSSSGKRICTKKEWQRACAGSDNRLYPYGYKYDPSKCVTKPDSSEALPVQPSGSLTECRTPEGIFDMSGNMAEWVEGGALMGGSGDLSGKAGSCNAETGGSESAYYGTRCCTSPVASP